VLRDRALPQTGAATGWPVTAKFESVESWEAMAVVGFIARPHGLRGQVVVNPETDFPEDRFRPDSQVFTRRGDAVEALTITTARFQQGRPVLGLRGVDDMDAALQYSGAELRVPIEWLAPLPDGIFYRHDLIGCAVVTVSGDRVGIVNDVEGTLAGSRLVLDSDNGEVLVPMAADICISIDIPGRQIVVNPPAGLLEVNARPRRPDQV
jgi:16S rRNA processing protein RimM